MDSGTVLTIDDLRKALLRRVDLEEIESAVFQQLNLPSRSGPASSSFFLLRQVSPELTDMLLRFLEGSHPKTSNPGMLRKTTLVPFSPRGISVADYLQPLLKKIKPAVVAVDASPEETGAALHYACSLHYGLRLGVEVSLVEGTSVRKRLRFQPGDFLPELAIYSLQNQIPLIPLGTMPRVIASEHQFAYGQLLQEAWNRFIQKKTQQMPVARLESLSQALMQQVFNQGIHFAVEREELINQSCYLASRVFDLVRYVSAEGYKSGPVVVLYRIEHALDFPQLVKAFWADASAVAELYRTPELPAVRTFEIRAIENREETASENFPSRHAQNIESGINTFLSARIQEAVDLEDVDRICSAAAWAVRTHPFIAHPPGVRGTLAAKEIAQGYGIIRGKLCRHTLAQAAYLAFRPRTRVRPGEAATLDEIFKGVFSRVIYGIPLYPAGEETVAEKRRLLTPEELSMALLGLSEAAFRTLSPEEGLPTDDPVFAEQAMNHPLVQQALKDALKKGLLRDLHPDYHDLLGEIEERGYLDRFNSSHLTLSRGGHQKLKEGLEEALARGELSREEVAERLSQARSLPVPSGIDGEKLVLSPEKETELLAEIMDFQHQGRSKSSSLEDLYVHYALNEKKGISVSAEKLDYERLKILIHQMEKQGMVNISGEKKRFTLSHRSLERLLEGLVRRQDSQILSKRAFRREHETDKTEVRRYKRGDVFHDISIRHTLRRIIRKAKTLADINHSDLRSFEKEPSNQVDIAVCVDISASMKEGAKLRYAKMAIAELAKAAMTKHDRMGIVAFSNLGEVVVPLTDKIIPLLEATMTLRAEQYTNIGNGLLCARRMLLKDRNTNPKYIILITDGQPNAALSQEYDGETYHERVAAFSRQTTMETKKAMGKHHALREAGKTSRKHIKISVVYICPEEAEDKDSEKTVREIARIGAGRFHKVKAIERLPLEALAAVG